MRYRRLQTLGFAVLLATLTAIHCIPTEAQADRRRRWTTYGSDRGRLVVACDMTSDTCSDGRRITTERATPVPCETSPGVWAEVGVDQGCYSVRGLESWAANTSYVGYGAELDRQPWIRQVGISVASAVQGWRIGNAAGVLRFLTQELPAQDETSLWTASCTLRKGNVSTVLLSARRSGTAGTFELTDDWATYSHTTTVAEGQIPGVSVGTNGETEEDFFYSAGCWLTKSDTPGRPCWGGEAPVTCDDDRHTVSTEGWPTTEGEISVTLTVGDTDSIPVIIDGRATSGDVGPMLYVTSADSNSIGWRSDSVTLTAPNVIERHKTHRIVAGRRDGRLYLVVDGVRHEGPEAPPLDWQGEAILGRGRAVVVYQGINGSISSLTVRNYEEVSP